MKNHTYLKAIIILLIISNIFLLVFLFCSKASKKEGPRNLIIERLHFDPDQIKKYDILIKDHRSKMSENREDVIQMRTKLYSNLKFQNNKSTNDSLIIQIAEREKLAEVINYRHFEDIRNICSPEQQKYFDKLVFDLAKIFPKSQTRK